MFHASQAVLALSRDENPTVFQKTLGLNDFYFGSDEDDFPLGNIQMVGKSQAPMFRGEKPTQTKLAPHWTLERIAAHAIDFWLSTEDLPLPENRVTVDGEGKRLARVQGRRTTSRSRSSTRSCESLLGKLDMNPDHLIHRFAYLKNEIPVAGCAHQAGTVRFGTDPATSALNVDCRAHEVDNLYVVDTSVFPSIGAVNPALTAMANSLRVGDHLLARMSAVAGRRAGPSGVRAGGLLAQLTCFCPPRLDAARFWTSWAGARPHEPRVQDRRRPALRRASGYLMKSDGEVGPASLAPDGRIARPHRPGAADDRRVLPARVVHDHRPGRRLAAVSGGTPPARFPI